MLTRRGLRGAILVASARLAIVVLTLVSTNAEPQSAPALTAKLKMVCGQSDVIWKYIVNVMGRKKATMNNGNRGRQGESIRHFLLYPDNSWF